MDAISFLRQCGVIVGSDGALTIARSKLPKLRFDKKTEMFVLSYPGPIGFGRQQFEFDYFDFVEAFYKTQHMHDTSVFDRMSIADYFLGSSWVNNEKSGRIASVIFCFNLTPSLLKKASKSKVVLHPKKLHCSKYITFQTYNDLQSAFIYA